METIVNFSVIVTVIFKLDVKVRLLLYNVWVFLFVLKQFSKETSVTTNDIWIFGMNFDLG